MKAASAGRNAYTTPWHKLSGVRSAVARRGKPSLRRKHKHTVRTHRLTQRGGGGCVRESKVCFSTSPAIARSSYTPSCGGEVAKRIIVASQVWSSRKRPSSSSRMGFLFARRATLRRMNGRGASGRPCGVPAIGTPGARAGTHSFPQLLLRVCSHVH